MDFQGGEGGDSTPNFKRDTKFSRGLDLCRARRWHIAGDSLLFVDGGPRIIPVLDPMPMALRMANCPSGIFTFP